MTVPDIREKALALRGRLQELVGKRWCLALVVGSCAYVLSYVVLDRSAHYHRQVDFYGNSARSWVELGSMKFSPDGWQTFMGIVYHPILFAILSMPAILLAALVASALAVLVLGLLASSLESRAEARRRREQRAYDLEAKRIEVEKRRPLMVGATGVGGVAVVAIRRICNVCESDVDGSGAGCPNCGASWMQS